MSAGNSRAADEIAAEIQETRARIDRTIDTLEERLSPGHLLDTAIDYLRTRSRAGGRGAGGEDGAAALGDITIAMRDNPIATALIGIGIGLVGVGVGALFASAVPPGGRGPAPLPGGAYDPEEDYEEAEPEYDERRRHRMEEDVFVGPVER